MYSSAITGTSSVETSAMRRMPPSRIVSAKPVNPANRALYEQYRGLAERFGNLHLLGRLAEYQYYNMDAIAARALDLAERL